MNPAIREKWSNPVTTKPAPSGAGTSDPSATAAAAANRAIRPGTYDQIVFSGGGTRCFWHGGFLSVVGSVEELRPERISCVSGGALSGAAWIAGHDVRCREVMTEIFERNDRNLTPRGERLTPHQELYREAVERILGDGGEARVADGPIFQVVLSLPPQNLPPRLTAPFFIALYQLDHAVRSTPHMAYPRRGGLGHIRVDARQAARDGKLVDLICAAATIPPVFDVPQWEGQRVLDGGMHCKAPLPEPDEGETLLLLTRRYDNLPDIAGRTYVQPSCEVDADKIDFTDPRKIEDTWDQGERDAREWLG